MKKIKLKDISTKAPANISKEDALKEMDEMALEISELQRMFNANGDKSILIILQWMDASWKDSVVKKVFSCINPMGLSVKGYGAPAWEEKEQHYLWRIWKETPKKWMIQIFNRSHYEDILVPTVEGFIPEKQIEKRYDHINDFEKALADEGTIILKFYLHMSKDKQKERLRERLTLERKYFKYDHSDAIAREKWDDYIDCYEKIFDKTNKEYAPWYIVPTDNKWYKSYFVMKEVHKTLKGLDMNWPKLKDNAALKQNKK